MAVAFVSCGSDNLVPENNSTKNIKNANYPLSTNDEDDNPEVFPLNVEFTTIAQSEIRDYQEASPLFIPNRVIQDVASWNAFLSQSEELMALVGDVAIDFETEQIVSCIYFDSYYITNISLVTENQGNVTVKVDYFDNYPISITGEAKYPFHLIKMPKITKETIFEIEYETEPPYQYY